MFSDNDKNVSGLGETEDEVFDMGLFKNIRRVNKLLQLLVPV